MRATKLAFWCALTVMLTAGAAPAERVDRPHASGPSREGTAARYAYFEIDGLIRESLPSVYLFEVESEALHALLRRIDRAGRDDNITGIIVKIGSLGAGWAKAQEIRGALLQCREEGKDVICYLEGGRNVGYYLATAGGRIVLPPAGHLMLLGVRAECLFLKGLLDKIGVKGEFVQAGSYKTAGETLTRQEPSPEFRESVEGILRDYYEQLLDGIAEGRDIPVSRAARLVKNGPFTASQAREAGAVDDVMFYDELLADLRDRHGGEVAVESDYGRKSRPDPFKPGAMSFFSMLMGAAQPRRVRPAGPAIAVIYAVGPIVRGDVEGLGFGQDLVASTAFIKTIRGAVADENVKAIVVRVDSPGGSALACDAIWRELRLADQKKPVIASLSDVAASGGYYIAAGARKIFAEPGCLTGSIGVFTGKLVLSGLCEKIGLNVVVMEQGGRTGIMSPFSEFSQDERRKLETLVRDTYDTFLARVAETRPDMSAEDLDRAAQGRLWTAKQAKENGLIDSLGGLRAAIAAAKEAAGIPADQRVYVLELPRPRSLVELLLFGKEDEARALPLWSGTQMLALPKEVRPYLMALLSLRDEVSLCMMPARVTVR
ncbi:MAG: signal peptide peptidase SppA [Candidatus Brocadiae bacterium]|nr:signal peptide peptidase SppA [Candidatus Brocadiia bacterium]